ncbi:MAG: hotdog domain-containing protein [Chloroflexota bacterium]
MLTDTVISHLVKPEHLQHHGTLFAGRMSEWLVETCFITACRFVGRPEDVVCAQVHGVNFNKPIDNGDIVEIRARIALVGTTSMTVYGRAKCNEDGDDMLPRVSGMATFVTVDKSGRPYAHGLKLPEEYIARNRKIHEAAIQAKKRDLLFIPLPLE